MDQLHEEGPLAWAARLTDQILGWPTPRGAAEHSQQAEARASTLESSARGAEHCWPAPAGAGCEKGHSAIVAVKVWSGILQAPVWVVADDPPRVTWPTDAPVYTHREVKMLQQVGPNAIQWVHALKVLYGAKLIRVNQAGDAYKVQR